MEQQKKNGNIVAIVTMFFLFAMISFVTNLAAPFGTIWRNEYAGSNVLGMMGNMMNFLAYLFNLIGFDGQYHDVGIRYGFGIF